MQLNVLHTESVAERLLKFNSHIAMLRTGKLPEIVTLNGATCMHAKIHGDHDGFIPLRHLDEHPQSFARGEHQSAPSLLCLTAALPAEG